MEVLMMEALRIPAAVFLVASVAGAIYTVVATLELVRFVRRDPPPPAPSGGVTILKPLCGEEVGLYENLRSFCTLEGVQVLFGVRDAADPAVWVVERLRSERPGADLALVVEPRVHGHNLKVSNLLNLLPRAVHDLLVIADSDIRVRPGYREAVTAPLADPDVGLVTCLYVARPEPGAWSRLASMWVNHGFLPSAVVAERLGARGCFGATLALRRETLESVGGLLPFKDVLADDHALGAAVRESGKRVVLSSHLVDMVVSEPSLSTLVSHELRWLRTIRSVEPWGYLGMALTHPVALGILAVVLSGFSAAAWATLLFAFACRFALVLRADSVLGLRPTAPGWILLRDGLSFALFLCGLFGTRVVWREQRLRIRADGALTLDGGSLR